MNKTLMRGGILLLACLLAACPSKKAPKPAPAGQTLPPVNTRLPSQLAGQRAPAGTSVSGGGAVYTAADYSALPQWTHQHFAASLDSFLKGCAKLQNQPGWQSVCIQAAQTPRHNHAARRFFEQYFTPWQVNGNGSPAGTVTGYYEPVLHGSASPTAQARFPIFGIPYDFVSVELPAALRNSKTTVRVRQTGQNSGVIDPAGSYAANLAAFPTNERSKALKGRFEGSRFVPYHTRREINAGALNGKAPVLGYADDPVELFFLQIQGSGRLKTPQGRYIRLGYADKNEYPYVSVARYMADKGYLPLAQTDMQGIKNYIRQNPQRLAEILGQNPSFVFFRVLEDNGDGPVGALGTPLTGGYSGAVDKHYITLGAPLFLATTHPDTRHGLNRLIMAQDTGSAIKGAVRVDFFWGYGDEAGRIAGKMKHPGYVWQLLPNGMNPRYTP